MLVEVFCKLNENRSTLPSLPFAGSSGSGIKRVLRETALLTHNLHALLIIVIFFISVLNLSVWQLFNTNLWRVDIAVHWTVDAHLLWNNLSKLFTCCHLYISLKQLKEDPCLGETLQPGGCRLPDGQLGLLEIRIILAIDQNPLNARYTGADQPLNCKQCNPLQAASNKLHHYRSWSCLNHFCYVGLLYLEYISCGER